MLRAILRHSLVIAAALALPLSAHAATNGKWYSGLQCQHRTGIYYQSMGTVYSLQDQSTSVHCPFETDEGKISSAQIRVYDQHPNEAVFCSVYAEGAFGDTIYQDWETKSTTLTGSTVQTLSYGVIDTIGAYYFAECYIPGPHNGLLSSIVAFNITES